jgi:hypothetical protein
MVNERATIAANGGIGRDDGLASSVATKGIGH